MLTNKICVVTGGAQGIGRCIVETFAKNGAKKIFACDTNIEKMADLTKNYPCVEAVELNVCDRKGIKAFAASVKQKYTTIDVLVNNAGITRDNLIEDITEEDWDLVLDINLKGVFNMTQAIAPMMMENGSGSIISMASIIGTDGNIGQSNYAASKGGIIAMTKGWAKEFTRNGARVRVNCIAPGLIATAMTQNVPKNIMGSVEERILLGHSGTTEDIAKGVLFLASENSSFITGQTLKIDGGLVM